jgi:hypothetical protein
VCCKGGSKVLIDGLWFPNIKGFRYGGGNEMKRLAVLLIIAVALVGMAGAANYMYEKASVKGVGYKNVEMIISTQIGYNGLKLVEKESGSGNVITERTELEAERQLRPVAIGDFETDDGVVTQTPSGWTAYPCDFWNANADNPYYIFDDDSGCAMDYINFTKDAEFEYMPVSYQTGTYDQKWIEKLCVQNYRIGAVLTEMYTHAEHLQKTTEVKTRWYQPGCGLRGEGDTGGNCCTGVLEANLNSNVIGVAHIGWLSRGDQPDSNLKGRHAEWGRSVEDLTGVFSIEKFIQLWGNSTCGAISVDWLPCV